ncbi:hypothetical protein GOE30_21450 [Salmonella enterica]|nr:hypothetical protein [Salmonella enterica]EBS0250501.1 hypothetical protein [Salmonella enterica subsp. enterica serovar Give]EDE7121736.1 hypothetical protein [Salmonella enterica subsp. enterica serovar Hvittingfoss]ECM1026248.1 hypothetical protein [Salmonella enterica subsp. enterica serovar Give]EDH3337234.1 hypothetical protein [Salmonella enterica]
MKNVPESVIAELRQLSGKIHKLCIKNNMPCVVSYAWTSDEKDVSRILSAYTNSKASAYDRPIVAATILLKMDEVPGELISLLKLMECEERTKTAACSKENVDLH